MPTREEAEKYKRRMEILLKAIADSKLPDYRKDQLIDELLEKWEAAHEALLGLGVPLDEENED